MIDVFQIAAALKFICLNFASVDISGSKNTTIPDPLAFL